jgi:HSP20 family molecular chaperone IbpA
MNHEITPNGAQSCAPTNGSSGATTCQAPSVDSNRNSAAAPRFRTSTTEQAITVRIELSGVAQGGVTLTVEDGVLQLDARQSFNTPTDEGVLRRALEFRLPDYRGRWRLPENVDTDAITSTLRHGVLEVSLPIQKPARRTISIV